MRPVNLIPERQRRARDGSSRTGPLAFIFVGALFVLLAGVAMLMLSSNQITERKSEVADLKARKALATDRADRLAPYANFRLVADQRTQTIVSLADSRFDWVRVIRQLSIVIPPGVWLTELSASAGGGAGGAGESAASGIAGPSLALDGCAPGQNTVAALVASLKEIDGVTRVGLESSGVTEEESGGASSAEGGSCKGKNGVSFSLVIAFDAAPPSPDSAEIAAEVPPSEEPGSSEAAPSSPEAAPAG